MSEDRALELLPNSQLKAQRELQQQNHTEEENREAREACRRLVREGYGSDAVSNATGSDRGSTAGDFKAAGCPLVRAGKMNQREANGLALVRTMLQAAGRDAETPWLLWTKACEGLMATWPTLPRHPRDVEKIADGCANHSLDAVRYGVQWWRAKWRTGIKNGPHPLMWSK